MKPIDSITGYTIEGTPEKVVQRHVHQEAKKASTIGDLRDGVRERLDQLAYPNAGEVNAEQDAMRQQYIEAFRTADQNLEEATKGSDALRIDTALAGTTTQGYATIAQGEQSIRLNPDAAANTTQADGVSAMKNLIAHERAHAEEQGVR